MGNPFDDLDFSTSERVEKQEESYVRSVSDKGLQETSDSVTGVDASIAELQYRVSRFPGITTIAKSPTSRVDDDVWPQYETPKLKILPSIEDLFTEMNTDTFSGEPKTEPKLVGFVSKIGEGVKSYFKKSLVYQSNASLMYLFISSLCVAGLGIVSFFFATIAGFWVIGIIGGIVFTVYLGSLGESNNDQDDKTFIYVFPYKGGAQNKKFRVQIIANSNCI